MTTDNPTSPHWPWSFNLWLAIKEAVEWQDAVREIARDVGLTEDEAFRFVLLVAEHKGWPAARAVEATGVAVAENRVVAEDVRRKLAGERPRPGSDHLLWRN